MFQFDFTINDKTKRKCILCNELIGRGKFTMLVTFNSHGMTYESSYHFSCVERQAEAFINDGNYPQRYSKLQERIASGGRLFG